MSKLSNFIHSKLGKVLTLLTCLLCMFASMVAPSMATPQTNWSTKVHGISSLFKGTIAQSKTISLKRKALLVKATNSASQALKQASLDNVTIQGKSQLVASRWNPKNVITNKVLSILSGKPHIPVGGVTVVVSRVINETATSISRVTVNAFAVTKKGRKIAVMGRAAFKKDKPEDDAQLAALNAATERATKALEQEVPDPVTDPIIEDPLPTPPHSVKVNLENLKVERGHWWKPKDGTITPSGLVYVSYDAYITDFSSQGFRGKVTVLARDTDGNVIWVGSENESDNFFCDVSFGAGSFTRAYKWTTHIPTEIMNDPSLGSIGFVVSTRGDFWDSLRRNIANVGAVLQQGREVFQNSGFQNVAGIAGNPSLVTNLLQKSGLTNLVSL
jgi:hypothetical protein